MDRALFPAIAKPVIYALAAGVTASVVVVLIGSAYRWRWWFTSPNDLGAVVGSAIPIWAVLVIHLPPPRGLVRRYFVSAIMILVGFCLLSALIGSGSRGAWVSAISALCAGTILTIRNFIRIAYGVIAGSILIGVLLVPVASARISRSDESIQSRWDLWSETGALIADNPMGWGTGTFSNIHDKWYKLRERGAFIWHPLNDSLYIAAEDGLPVLWIVSAFYFAIIISLNSASARASPYACAISVSLISFFIAGMFTTLLRSGGATFYLVAALSAGVAIICWRRVSITYPLMSGFLISSVFVLSIWSYGLKEQKTFPWKPATNHLSAISPRFSTPIGRLLIVQRNDDDTAAICKSVLRPLATSGFRGILLSMRDFNSETYTAELKRFSPQGVVFLSGNDQVVKFPIFSKAYLSGVKCVALLDRDPSELQFGMPTFVINGFALQNAGVPREEYCSVFNSPIPRCWTRNFRIFKNNLISWLKKYIQR